MVTFLSEEEKNYFVAEDTKKLKDLESQFSAQGCTDKPADDQNCARLKGSLEQQRAATQQMHQALARWQADPLVVVRACLQSHSPLAAQPDAHSGPCRKAWTQIHLCLQSAVTVCRS